MIPWAAIRVAVNRISLDKLEKFQGLLDRRLPAREYTRVQTRRSGFLTLRGRVLGVVHLLSSNLNNSFLPLHSIGLNRADNIPGSDIPIVSLRSDKGGTR